MWERRLKPVVRWEVFFSGKGANGTEGLLIEVS